jgi:LmbE family N-acetylglucosaminyl deacetylase
VIGHALDIRGQSYGSISGNEAEPPTFVIDVREWITRKLAALRCHQTQMGVRNPFAQIDETVARRCLGIEQFRRAAIETSRDSVLERLGEPVIST